MITDMYRSGGIDKNIVRVIYFMKICIHNQHIP